MKVVVVLPTYNERANIVPLIEALVAAAAHVPHECEFLVVDDTSPDGTGDAVRELQQRLPSVYLLTGEKKGLGVAYARGLAHALDVMHADAVVHMDADFSHDPAYLPQLVAKIDEGYGFVVGARYIEGGGVSDDWGWRRRLISRLANFGARVIAGLGELRDCTNGYRAYRADVLSGIDLAAAPRGYAILTYLAYHALMSGARVAEVPVVFAARAHGTSKLALPDVIEFFMNAWWIRYDRRERFLRYATGGLSSVAANLVAAALLYYVLALPALVASVLAVEASVLYSIVWRQAWARALRRPRGPSNIVARTHVLAVPSAVLTVAVVFALTRAGQPFIVAQAVGIVPALAWNYFIGDRGLDILRRARVLKDGPQPGAAPVRARGSG